MSEFNPTFEDKLALESSLLDLRKKKSGFVSMTLGLQLKATTLKAILTNPKVAAAAFDVATRERVINKAELSELQQNILEVNNEMSGKRKLLLAVEEHLKKAGRSVDFEDGLLGEVILMKEDYQRFASDPTRVASMKTMASQVAESLEKVIKKYQ